jgi:hypothetical protein
MKKHKRNGRGMSYEARVAEVNRIYDEHRRSGLSNVEIWRRYVYPKLFISERTFYNMLNASAVIDIEAVEREKQLWIPFPD